MKDPECQPFTGKSMEIEIIMLEIHSPTWSERQPKGFGDGVDHPRYVDLLLPN